MANTAAGHLVAVIGGATAGAEVASRLADRGVSVSVFEQNVRPYGKIEDGLPRWHEALRNKEYKTIDEKLSKPGVSFVPNTKIGEDIGFKELVNDWGFSAVVLANGAWRDRPLPIEGADAFIGLSVANMLSKDHVRSMADNPIIFAMANPDPEITYYDANDARADVIMATGRSDYPNQVNNVLGFPFIFRGALDVRARAINDEMKLAASRALAELAKQDVPDQVRKAYHGDDLRFGPDYIIPKPLDPRVLLWEAPAVAKAAVDTGVARIQIDDWDEYREGLERIYGPSRGVVRSVIRKARRVVKRIVFPEGEEDNILRAAQILIDDKVARPILVGNPNAIRERIEEQGLDLTGAEIVDPRVDSEHYAKKLYQVRCRKGMLPHEANMLVRTPLMHAVMMVYMDEADGMVCGINRSYSETLGPSLKVLRLTEGVKKVSGMYAVAFPDRTIFFADATVNIDPTAEDLAEIALLAGKTVRSYFDIEPRIAMLSFSSFGSTRHKYSEKVRQATEMVRAMDPSLVIDGEIQADAA